MIKYGLKTKNYGLCFSNVGKYDSKKKYFFLFLQQVAYKNVLPYFIFKLPPNVSKWTMVDNVYSGQPNPNRLMQYFSFNTRVGSRGMRRGRVGERPSRIPRRAHAYFEVCHTKKHCPPYTLSTVVYNQFFNLAPAMPLQGFCLVFSDLLCRYCVLFGCQPESASNQCLEYPAFITRKQ